MVDLYQICRHSLDLEHLLDYARRGVTPITEEHATVTAFHPEHEVFISSSVIFPDKYEYLAGFAGRVPTITKKHPSIILPPNKYGCYEMTFGEYMLSNPTVILCCSFDENMETFYHYIVVHPDFEPMSIDFFADVETVNDALRQHAHLLR